MHIGNFHTLYTREGLSALDALFCAELELQDVALFNRLMSARANPELPAKEESELLIALAWPVEAFIAKHFGVEKELQQLRTQHDVLAPLYACKRLFVQRIAAKKYNAEQAAAFDAAALLKTLQLTLDEVDALELAYSTQVMQWMSDEPQHADALDNAARYAAWALYSTDGKHKHKRGLLFKLPKKIDPAHLIAVETETRDGVRMLKLPDHELRMREGFALTDTGGTLAQALDHANYCIFCHNQGRDSCSKGAREKDGTFKKNAAAITLAGCPLEEKISEMNLLKSEGAAIGALAMVCVDNPLCAGTGHRICNDCMKACIYQKQEPVNIPLVETRVLQDVLQLPYGFEIYSLLTRWNPLNLKRPVPKPATGKRVLVAGLGPAGYTLAHHLLNDGHTVVGIDGLKIEPLAATLAQWGKFEPVKDARSLEEPLDKRTLAGFGGVAEYGITVRWNKNYLKLIRLLLERRDSFRLFGGVRFGSTLTTEKAFTLGFDHIALCLGAGKPTLLDVPNAVARGVRAASDFLMSLQLTGAAKENSIANLQLRLPVVVVGGGLTAIDTATEALAYYPVQVEKFLQRFETLCAAQNEEAVRKDWSEEERLIADIYMEHAREIRKERALAATQKRPANILKLLKQWGGATLAYRKQLTDAPSYRLNHEEVEKALEEGITIAENLTPTNIHLDRFEHVEAISLTNAEGQTVTLPAGAVLVAAGTSPNTVLAREDGRFTLDGKYFQAVDATGKPVKPEQSAKPAQAHVLIAASHKGISFFGDLHPSFAGNVVKAMASAKQGYPVVSALLAYTPKAEESEDDFFARMDDLLVAKVHQVNRLTPTIVEVVMRAPLAAEAFEPGQFYRLQNFEALAATSKNTTLAMEGLAMTGAWVNKEAGLISVIVLEMGGSSNLCAAMKPGEPVVLMGPTGAPTEIPKGETVLLAGGGLGNAVLFSIGKALRASGCRVLYFAGYRRLADRYKVEEIEAAADHIIWCCDEAPGFVPLRTSDSSFVGNIVQAMVAYGEGKLGNTPLPLNTVSRIIAIGSDRMMAAVAEARHGVLKPHLQPNHVAIGSINSPMQCMMKEICAQCLQKHVDPVSGKIRYVYSCAEQDQLLDQVDFKHLNQRLLQNSVQEKVTAQWLVQCKAALTS